LQRHITASAIFLACAQLPFLINLLLTLRRPAEHIENPWQATTMEWAPNAPHTHPTDQQPIVYRGPCHYSDTGDEFLPQWSAATPSFDEQE
jgi:cytochrome c oxidase subunit 1